MLPTPVLRLLNVLSDASLQCEEEYEGWCNSHTRYCLTHSVFCGSGDVRTSRWAINRHKNSKQNCPAELWLQGVNCTNREWTEIDRDSRTCREFLKDPRFFFLRYFLLWFDAHQIHNVFVALSFSWMRTGLWSPIAQILKNVLMNLSRISAGN